MVSKIFLVGMMGVGKTTLGKQLAKQLNYQFLDLDKSIELMTGKSISHIFETEGNEAFRIIEQQALMNTAHLDKVVIATGGGTPCYFENMQWMNTQGTTIYLKATSAFIVSRIKPNQHLRPLLKQVLPDNLIAFISDLLLEREVFYHQASLVFELPSDKLLEAIKSAI